MKYVINKGFTIVEVFISIIILSTLCVLVYNIILNNNYYDNSRLYVKQAYIMGYNFTNIIKSDPYLYLHYDLYFDKANEYVVTTSINNQYDSYLYFDENNRLTDSSSYQNYYHIRCIIGKMPEYERFNYQVRIYSKNKRGVDSYLQQTFQVQTVVDL